jgi:hypothetical protein
MATAFFKMSRSIRSRSFSRRSREISAAGSGTECGARRRYRAQRRPRIPPSASIAPVAQHRGGNAQLACDLAQRPTAAHQQGYRFLVELIRKMTPSLAHSTPFRSRRSLAKVSTNSGEPQEKYGQFSRTLAAARYAMWACVKLDSGRFAKHRNLSAARLARKRRSPSARPAILGTSLRHRGSDGGT